MLKFSLRVALCAALLHVVPACASILGNDACQALLAEGHALAGQGKPADAWDAFQRARKADPTASMPVSELAQMMFDASQNAPADKAEDLRNQAEAAARDALRLDAADPVAQEILRGLQEGNASPLHVPTPDAARITQEGETLFAQKRFDEALAKYELAAERDPQYSAAWVYAGDCYFARKQWHESEARFRKAAEIEPLNGQAWRYLSDALAMQGDYQGAETALINGIAAHPSQQPNWEKLDQLMTREGMPLKRLNLKRKAQGKIDSSTKTMTVHLDGSAQQGGIDSSIWLAFAIMEAAPKKEGSKPARSAFQAELEAWQLAMQAATEMEADGKGKLADPGLVTMQRLSKAGQLEPAILLLMYRESYRPEFEEWKRAHPDGVKAFIATYGLRP